MMDVLREVKDAPEEITLLEKGCEDFCEIGQIEVIELPNQGMVWAEIQGFNELIYKRYVQKIWEPHPCWKEDT